MDGVFEKGEPYREAFEPKLRLPAVSVGKDIPVLDSGKFTDAFIKHDGVMMPTLFVIISGGEKREKDYFKVFQKSVKFPRIKVYFQAQDADTLCAGLSPNALLDMADKVVESLRRGSPDGMSDLVFLVSDMDHFKNELIRIKPQCAHRNYKLVISNPCFELWLYYGHFCVKPVDFEIPKERLKISSSFKFYLGGKVSGGVDPRKAYHKLEYACKSAEANYNEDDSGLPGLFSTSMFVLGRELLGRMD